MSARLLLLCPGQGGQHSAMNALAAGDPAGAALLADAQLPATLADAHLFDNRVAQPAVVTATLAMWAALRPRLAALPLAPALVAGYSVGELSAWSVAGALSAPDAIALARTRAALMDVAAAASAPQQGLLAVSSLARARTQALSQALGCAIAIVNDDDACVVGGPATALATLAAQALALGARTHSLPVTVAAHTPLLAAAVAPFAAALDAAPFAPPRCPVLQGTSGASLADRRAAIAALSGQLAHTIAWADCMDAASEAGITVALELGPGAALSRMLQARHPAIACRSVAEFRTIEGIVGWLQRQA